jgi:hypothetical protein
VPKQRRQRKRISGLQKAQVKFLAILADALGPLNVTQLLERAGVNPISTNNVANSIGRVSKEAREARDKELGYASLITLKYVRVIELDIDGKSETVFDITDLGREALRKISS